MSSAWRLHAANGDSYAANAAGATARPPVTASEWMFSQLVRNHFGDVFRDPLRSTPAAWSGPTRTVAELSEAERQQYGTLLAQQQGIDQECPNPVISASYRDH